MSKSKFREFRKLVRKGSSKELTEELASGQFRERHFRRALTHCAYEPSEFSRYKPATKGSKGPAFYKLKANFDNELKKLVDTADELGLDSTDVVIDEEATTLL